MLRSDNVSVRGTPFQDLGVLRAEEIRYSKFSSALWNLEPLAGGVDCEFATSPSGPFQCDLAETVERSLNDSYPLAQFRVLPAVEKKAYLDQIQEVATGVLPASFQEETQDLKSKLTNVGVSE